MFFSPYPETMIDVIASILTSIILGFVFAIPSIFLGYWLQKIGKAPNRAWLSIFFCIVLSFIKQIWLSELSWGWFALLVIAGSTLGIYRMDFYWASKNQSHAANTDHQKGYS